MSMSNVACKFVLSLMLALVSVSVSSPSANADDDKITIEYIDPLSTKTKVVHGVVAAAELAGSVYLTVNSFMTLIDEAMFEAPRFSFLKKAGVVPAVLLA